MITYDIGIIGGGNLGRSIAMGLLFSKKIKASSITLTRRKVHLIEDLSAKGIKVSNNNLDAVKGKKVIIIAVKPHQVEDVINEVLTAEEMEVALVSEKKREETTEA